MAARYVNPENVAAQGQYFYTGLLPGAYDTAGGGGGANVYGAGSGGAAGVSPDYTGADATKSWEYGAAFDINLPAWEKEDDPRNRPPQNGHGPEGNGHGPEGNGEGPEQPPRGRRRRPVPNGGPVEPPQLPQLPQLGPGFNDPTGGVPSAERPQITMGENPEERPTLELPRWGVGTRATMDKRNTADRARRAEKNSPPAGWMPATDAMWMARQLTDAPNPPLASQSASRQQSRKPVTIADSI